MVEAGLAVAALVGCVDREPVLVQHTDELFVPCRVFAEAVHEVHDGTRMLHPPHVVGDGHALFVFEARHGLILSRALSGGVRAEVGSAAPLFDPPR